MKRIFICIMLVMALVLSGCSFNSCIRVGYVGREGSESWSARYKKLDGEMYRTFRIDEGPVYITIGTKEGGISVSIEDSDGNTLFTADGEGEYTAEVSGKLRVNISADDHRGSFDIRTK